MSQLMPTVIQYLSISIYRYGINKSGLTQSWEDTCIVQIVSSKRVITIARSIDLGSEEYFTTDTACAYTGYAYRVYNHRNATVKKATLESYESDSIY